MTMPSQGAARVPVGSSGRSADVASQEQQEAPADVGRRADGRAALKRLLANALAATAALLVVLICSGYLVPAGNAACGKSSGCYSGCEMKRDLRGLLSFLLGAVLCSIITRDRTGGAFESASKMSLSHCLL